MLTFLTFRHYLTVEFKFLILTVRVIFAVEYLISLALYDRNYTQKKYSHKLSKSAFFSLSAFVKKVECCNIRKHGVTLMKWCNFLILSDSTCQFYHKANTCVRPYKKNGRGVTFIG